VYPGIRSRRAVGLIAPRNVRPTVEAARHAAQLLETVTRSATAKPDVSVNSATLLAHSQSHGIHR
jgi:hypothetical protein